MGRNHTCLTRLTTTLVLFFIGFSTNVFAKNIYTVESMSESGVISISLTLPNSPNAISLKARGIDWGLSPQIKNMRCDNVLIQNEKNGIWTLPEKCVTASWDVTPNRVTFGDIDASRQESIFIPNKSGRNILFSEATSLARIIDEGDAILSTEADIKILAATRADQRKSQLNPEWIIPAYNKAPEYYLIGDLEFQRAQLPDFNVTYFSDNPLLTEELKLNETHRKAINFLLDSVPAFKERHSTTQKTNLLVVWLGSNAKNKFIGGAAGHRSFISNYIYGDSINTNKNNLKTIVVISHEQFHQLIEIIRENNESQPAWIEEGLAQYYGLKALNNIYDPNNRDVSEITSIFINKDKPVELSFTELDKQFKEGNRGVYPLFYTQGATFWFMLDAALLENSQGEYGINDSIELLVNSKPNKSGGLPVEYQKRVIEIGGAKVQQLIDTYVDGNNKKSDLN